MITPLWMVILIFGKVAMTIGPLPYNEAECNDKRLAKLAEVQERFRALETRGEKLPKISGDDRDVTWGDFKIRCYRSMTRPEGGQELDPENML